MGLKELFKDKADDLNRIKDIDDPMARKIDWKPARKRTGSNFQTHFAVVENPSTLCFKRTFFMKFLPWLVIVFSVVLMYIMNDFNIDFRSYTFHDGEQYLKLGVVLFMFLMGLITMFFSSRHIVFDRRLGFYHKGWGQLGAKGIPGEGKNCTHLTNIHAIQIVSEIIRSKNSRYRSYELNLVLKDGKRICVVDHANQKAIRKDADLISRFLEVPVWDVTIDT